MKDKKAAPVPEQTGVIQPAYGNARRASIRFGMCKRSFQNLDAAGKIKSMRVFLLGKRRPVRLHDFASIEAFIAGGAN